MAGIKGMNENEKSESRTKGTTSNQEQKQQSNTSPIHYLTKATCQFTRRIGCTVPCLPLNTFPGFDPSDLIRMKWGRSNSTLPPSYAARTSSRSFILLPDRILIAYLFFSISLLNIITERRSQYKNADEGSGDRSACISPRRPYSLVEAPRDEARIDQDSVSDTVV